MVEKALDNGQEHTSRSTAEGGPQRQKSSWIGGTLRFCLGIAMLALLLFQTPLSDLRGICEQITPMQILFLLLISAVLIYISALKWSIFLASFNFRSSVLYLFSLYLVGYFINLLIPSYVGGDALRSWYVGKKAGQHQAFASTILERYTGIVAMMLLALLSMWWVTLVSWQIKLVIICCAVGLAFGSYVACAQWTVSLLHRAVLKRYKKLAKITAHLEKLQAALLIAYTNPRLIVKALLLSFLYHGFTIANTVAAAWAVGWWDPPIADLFVIVPIVLIVGAIPVSPAGLGIQEGAFYYFLTGCGATPAQALGVGLILRAKVYVLAVLGGVVWCFIKRGPLSVETSSGQQTITANEVG